jgi:hypothetical protein
VFVRQNHMCRNGARASGSSAGRKWFKQLRLSTDDDDRLFASMTQIQSGQAAAAFGDVIMWGARRSPGA